MSRYVRLAACVAFGALLGSAPAIAADKPDATIDFTGGAVAFIGGVSWGGGTLHYKGKDYPLQVGGLSLGEVGIKKFDAKGEVYHLTKVSDIEGTYAAGAGSITVAATLCLFRPVPATNAPGSIHARCSDASCATMEGADGPPRSIATSDPRPLRCARASSRTRDKQAGEMAARSAPPAASASTWVISGSIATTPATTSRRPFTEAARSFSS